MKNKFSLKYLYQRVLDEIKNAESWDWPDVIDNKYRHYVRAEALLDMLENLTVGHEGLGAYPNDERKESQFSERVKTFEYLLEKKK